MAERVRGGFASKAGEREQPETRVFAACGKRVAEQYLEGFGDEQPGNFLIYCRHKK